MVRPPIGTAGPLLLRALATERRQAYGADSLTARRLDALADWLDRLAADRLAGPTDRPADRTERGPAPTRLDAAGPAVAQADGAGAPISLPGAAPGPGRSGHHADFSLLEAFRASDGASDDDDVSENTGEYQPGSDFGASNAPGGVWP